MHWVGLHTNGKRSLISSSESPSEVIDSVDEGVNRGRARCRLSCRPHNATRARMVSSLWACFLRSVELEIGSQVSRTISPRSGISYWRGAEGLMSSSDAMMNGSGNWASRMLVSAFRKCRFRAFSSSRFRRLFFSRCKVASTCFLVRSQGSFAGAHRTKSYLSFSFCVSSLLSRLSWSMRLPLTTFFDSSGDNLIGTLGSTVNVMSLTSFWTTSSEERPKKAAMILNRISRSR